MDILSSADFAIISLKHFQFLEVIIPGQEKYRPKIIPENRNKKDLIFLTLNIIKYYK